MSAEDPYLDAGGHVLRNRFGLARAPDLDIVERRLVTQRIAEGSPQGEFDFVHLRSIHRHLFQDVYEWAGEPRTIDMTENGERFAPAAKIHGDLNAIHRDLRAKDYLRDLSPGDFAREAAMLIGDLNYVRAFREGNGRTQLIYLQQLAAHAGHPLDLTRIPAEPWIEAVQASMAGNVESMAAMILFALN